MLLGEGVEMLRYNPAGMCARLGGRQAVELQQQAVAQVYRAYSGRLEAAYKPEYVLHIGLRRVYAVADSNVVGNIVEAAGQIAVRIEVAYDMACKPHPVVVEAVFGAQAV